MGRQYQDVNESSGIGVLDKAVSVLAAAATGATLSELVARSGLARATAYRLAVGLEAQGLLTRDAAGRFWPGGRLVEFASAALHGPDLLAAAAPPVLEELTAVTGESAQLYRRTGEVRTCVAATERASGLRDSVPVGATLPMTAGSAAQALLAWAAPEDVAEVLPHAVFDARTLASVRRRGWAASVGEREAGVASVSAPVRAADGQVVAAISVSGPISRLGRRPGQRLAEAVLSAAARLRADA